MSWLFGLLFAIAATLLIVLFIRRYGPQEVSASRRGYVLTEDNSVLVTVEITRNPKRDAVCIVRARGAHMVEIGHTAVRVSASKGGRVVVRTVKVTTRGRAVAGEVGRCLALRAGDRLPFPDPAAP